VNAQPSDWSTAAAQPSDWSTAAAQPSDWSTAAPRRSSLPGVGSSGVGSSGVGSSRVGSSAADARDAGFPELAAQEHRVWVEHVMGMPVSVHARGSGARDPIVAMAVDALFSDLHVLEDVFSTYRPGSQVSRLQRGELRLEESADEVREVRRLCQAARVLTDGAFDAWAAVPGRPGVFDPTGLVKGWAVGRAARRLDVVDHVAFAIGAGGDILVRPGAAGRTWTVGIEDPRDRGRILARVPVQDGAVATSGTAARGLHIVSPRSGERATDVLSATVIGPSLLWADVYATAAVALGREAVDWVGSLHGTSGMLVLADGVVHRWQNAA
jgi:thiamine biosynthesis lipoprotein